MLISTLVFSPTADYLGTLTTQDGAFQAFELTPEGHARLDADLAEWKISGILALRDLATQTPEGQSFQIVMLYIQLSDPGFLTAFRHWTMNQGIQPFTAKEEIMRCWERLQFLPLKSSERLSLLSKINTLPVEDVEKWHTILDEAKRVVLS